MKEASVIIVGGGPAGATCARELARYGMDVLILDKAEFPRTKLCAGWITPRVLADLELEPAEYPYRLLTYRRIVFYIKGVPVPVPTHQYSIRRFEFDAFLLKRAGVPVHRHRVRQIRRAGGKYIIDDAYRCTWLVGAGGTHCPVYKALFAEIHPRDPEGCITTAEHEFAWQWQDPQCRLWFFDHGLPGYAWYVPKEKGYLNVGIGGRLSSLKKRGETINVHWERFARKLTRRGLTGSRRLSPKGHLYYLRGPSDHVEHQNAYILGDAAGLATRDMGEGIGPAVQSAILAARAIADGAPCSFKSISRWSIPQIIAPRAGRGNPAKIHNQKDANF